MSSSRTRDSSPAIPEPFPVSPVRFYELQECVSVFDEFDHHLMREKPTHKIVELDGQVILFER